MCPLPFTCFPECKKSRTIKSNRCVWLKGLPQKHLSAVGLSPSCICLSLNRDWIRHKDDAAAEPSPSCSVPLTSPTCTAPGPINGLMGGEWAFPSQESELQFYSVFRVGTKLHTLRGNYHGLLFSFLHSIYQIGRDTQRSSSGRDNAIAAVTQQQEVPLKGRVIIIKRKREIRIKLEREEYGMQI